MTINVFQHRLMLLKKATSLNAFANHCNIPYSTMRGFLEDSGNPTLENLKKIAAACNVTVGWLAGEENDEWTRTKNRGLPIERHMEVGEELKQISYSISRLLQEFGHAYPEQGDLGRATKFLGVANEAIGQARHYAEENMFSEHKGNLMCTFNVYYGKDFERQKREDEAEGGQINTA